MSVVTSYEPGEPCWVAVSAASPEQAARFYGGLFGWRQAALAGGCAWAVFELDGLAVAGLRPAETTPASWQTYFAVAALETTLAAIAAAGGRALAAEHLPGLARTCLAADPGGALFGVWEGGARAGGVVVDEPGSPTWYELRTEAAAAAARFYATVFAWRAEPRADAAAPYLVLRAGGRPCGLWQVRGRSRWEVYFAVEDAGRAAARAAALGGAVTAPVRETPYGRTAELRDPLGASFGVLELAETAVA